LLDDPHQVAMHKEWDEEKVEKEVEKEQKLK
jgi:hypothetical protein